MNDWGDATFADLAEVANMRRVEAWERAAFVATYAFNSNPFLRRVVPVVNPFDDAGKKNDYEKTTLENIFPESAVVNRQNDRAAIHRRADADA